MDFFQQYIWGNPSTEEGEGSDSLSSVVEEPCPVDEETGRVLETAEIRERGLKALRAKMQDAIKKSTQQSDKVRYPRDDDKFLLAFLRARKYKIQDAFMLLTNFSHFWYNPKHAEVINGLSAERVRATYELGIFELMPDVRDKFGNFCTALHMGRIDVHHPDYTPAKVLALMLYFLCKVFDEDEVQLHGFSYVETLEDFTFSKAIAMSLVVGSSDWKEVNALGIDTFPMRIRDIYIIHEPVFLDWFMTLIKPFMKAKLFKRMHLFGENVENLSEFFPLSQLPRAFGGGRNLPQSQFLDDMEKQERETGYIGGFAFPLNVEDPIGKQRKNKSTLS